MWNWKKFGIKACVSMGIAIMLSTIGKALDVGFTNEMALQQMQNTETTLLTNQTFNKVSVMMDVIMVAIIVIMFMPELKTIFKKIKGEI